MTSELFTALVRQRGEENGGVEEFRVIDAETIGCRYGDTVIRRSETGWRYGSNAAAYPTPAEAYENRRDDIPKPQPEAP